MNTPEMKTQGGVGAGSNGTSPEKSGKADGELKTADDLVTAGF